MTHLGAIINLISSAIPGQTTAAPAPTASATTATKKYDPDSKDGRELIKFREWLVATANKKVSGTVNSLNNPQPLFDSQDKEIAIACAKSPEKEQAKWDPISTRAISNSPSPEDLTKIESFQGFVTSEADAKVRALISSLSDTQPLFDSMDRIVAKTCAKDPKELATWITIIDDALLGKGVSLVESLGFSNPNRVKISFGLNPTSNVSAHPALEARLLPQTVSASLNYTPFKFNFFDSLFSLSLFGLDLSYGGNYVDNESHQLKLASPNAVNLKFAPLDEYLQFFASAGYQFKFNEFQTPTLLYPNAQDHTLQQRGGAGTDLRGTRAGFAIGAALTHNYSWFDHGVQKYAGLENFKFGGNEEEYNLDLALMLTPGNWFKSSEGWIPTGKFRLQVPLKGKTNLPNIRTFNNQLVYHQQQAKNYGEWKFDGLIESNPSWGSLTIFGSYQEKKIRGWSVETMGHVGLSWNPFNKIGPISAAYVYSNLDPSNPLETNGGQLSWTLPWFNEFLTVSTHLHKPSTTSNNDFIWGFNLTWNVLDTFAVDLPSIQESFLNKDPVEKIVTKSEPVPATLSQPNFALMVGEEKSFDIPGTNLADGNYEAVPIVGLEVLNLNPLDESTMNLIVKATEAGTHILEIKKDNQALAMINITVTAQPITTITQPVPFNTKIGNQIFNLIIPGENLTSGTYKAIAPTGLEVSGIAPEDENNLKIDSITAKELGSHDLVIKKDDKEIGTIKIIVSPHAPFIVTTKIDLETGAEIAKKEIEGTNLIAGDYTIAPVTGLTNLTIARVDDTKLNLSLKADTPGNYSLTITKDGAKISGTIEVNVKESVVMKIQQAVKKKCQQDGIDKDQLDLCSSTEPDPETGAGGCGQFDPNNEATKTELDACISDLK